MMSSSSLRRAYFESDVNNDERSVLRRSLVSFHGARTGRRREFNINRPGRRRPASLPGTQFGYDNEQRQ
jgi:hypothetical protein